MNRISPWGMPRAVRIRSRHAEQLGHKVCPRCQQELPFSAFTPSKYTATGVQGYCRACTNQRNRERRRPRTPEQSRTARDAQLRRDYGITHAQYEWILAGQGGVCAICRKPETKIGGRHGKTPLRLAVDHDHRTGLVRELLCADCNRALGCLGEDIEIAKRLLAYLKKHQGKRRKSA